MKKQVFIKTYTSAGVYKGVFFDFSFSSFQFGINSGLGDLQVLIPRKFDDFGEGDTISLGYELRIYISDSEAVSGTLIYSGEINAITPSISDEESVEVTCSGYVFQLAQDILEQGTRQVYFKYNAQELATTFKDIIDKYKATSSVDKISYTATSVATTSKSKAIELYMSSPLEAINNVLDVANYNWYWLVDATNTIYFQAYSATPNHYFIYGKDVISLTIDKNLRDVRNALLFSNGLNADDTEKIFKLYSDSTSIASYGRRFEIKRDERFKASTASSDEFGTRFVTSYKNPLVSVKVRVVDSNLAGGYDIETIKPGQTCKILNVNSNSALTSNMLITGLTYNIDYVDLEIVDTKKYIDREIANQRTTINNYAFSDNLPKVYTI